MLWKLLIYLRNTNCNVLNYFKIKTQSLKIVNHLLYNLLLLKTYVSKTNIRYFNQSIYQISTEI